jgi:hypothetical protein
MQTDSGTHYEDMACIQHLELAPAAVERRSGRGGSDKAG